MPVVSVCTVAAVAKFAKEHVRLVDLLQRVERFSQARLLLQYLKSKLGFRLQKAEVIDSGHGPRPHPTNCIGDHISS